MHVDTLMMIMVNYINNAIDLNLKAPILLIHKMMGFLNGVININSISGLENKKLRMEYSKEDEQFWYRYSVE